MAKFNYDDAEHKKLLQERALAQKPNVVGVVATERGWCIAQPSGYMEVLVSFAGLDELLGDLTPEAIDPTPVEVTPEPSVEEVSEEAPAEEQPATEEAPVKKKGGRPPKVQAPVEESAE